MTWIGCLRSASQKPISVNFLSSFTSKSFIPALCCRVMLWPHNRPPWASQSSRDLSNPSQSVAGTSPPLA